MFSAAHARLLGRIGLDRADDGLAADLVEGLGAVAGGVDAGHAGLQVLVGQHAHAGSVTPQFSRKPMLGLTPVALMTRSALERTGRWTAARAAARAARSPRRACRCSTLHALALAPVADHAAGRRAHHARHHAVAHLDHGELHAARGQRFHDDAADEAGAHLQHARALAGALRDGARVLQRPAVHARRRLSMPGIGGLARRRAGGDQQPVVGQRAAVVQRHRACRRTSTDLARTPRMHVDAQPARSGRRRGAGACPPRRCCPSAGRESPCASTAASGSSPTRAISSCGACLRIVSAAMTPAGPAPRIRCLVME